MDQLSQHFTDMGLLIRYGLSGFAGGVCNLLVYSFLLRWGQVWYLAAAAVAFLAALVVSFLLQKWWTFRDSRADPLVFQGSWYTLIAVGVLGVNLLLLFGLVDGLQWPKLIAQAVSLVSVSLISFLLNKIITFKL